MADLCNAIAHIRREDSVSLGFNLSLLNEYTNCLVECFVVAQENADVACQNWCVVLLADLLPQSDALITALEEEIGLDSDVAHKSINREYQQALKALFVVSPNRPGEERF
jgi:hypothetical protein